jgi:hypothetical protein
MNTSASLAVMTQLGVFEKMPKQGSITATELGEMVNLEPSVIGLFAASSMRLTRQTDLAQSDS